MTVQEAKFIYLLRLSDDALILGHRLGEWCSKAPILEEDLALTNIALDFIGRAESLLKYAALVENKGNSEDDLAYKRPERKFYNHLLCEQSNGDFAKTMLRQLLISHYELLLYSKLMESHDEQIAAIASKSIKEIKYHCKHSKDWCIRLGDGTTDSNMRMQNALNDLWMYTGELFESDEIDAIMLEAKIRVDVHSLESAWKITVMDILSEANLSIPETFYMQTGSKKGIHTEQLGYILAEMQYLPRAYPDAQW